jgi:F0F1-type ATP synthase membrane subunit c/vacuolar-type H+-ATPase subunit K
MHAHAQSNGTSNDMQAATPNPANSANAEGSTSTLELLLVGLYSAVAICALCCAMLVIMKKCMAIHRIAARPAGAAGARQTGLSEASISWLPTVKYTPAKRSAAHKQAAAAAAAATAVVHADIEQSSSNTSCSSHQQQQQHHTGSNDDLCAICLVDYIESEQLRVLPQCKHRYHTVCIDTWLRSKAMCPMCNRNVIAPRKPLVER